MDSTPSKPTSQLSLSNVGLAFGFIAFDAVLSKTLGLGIGALLVTSAVRCVVQLSLVALILQKVFDADNPWAVARRHTRMFTTVLLSNLGSTIPIAILGVRYAMSEEPFWRPTAFIPVVGILCGSIIANIVIAVDHVLRQLDENTDRIETYLAFGASRFEACRPLALAALRLALTPTISQMSVIGIIAIPGTMTGALLGGADVAQAARLQMVIMFLICGSSVLAALACTFACLSIVVDAEARVRLDKIDNRPHEVWRVRKRIVACVMDGICKAAGNGEEDESQAGPLLD
ncbi:hypothetical protein PHLGIDRAFT_22003 [Phlebiopsis gigantea 11061_1 CR5-6]|uniref:Uncharacterized protein n=1 Tax=Phlebiopsis gigantea (strain 11061_1 CR5-6) TaxID=745531 RepID=A0A0C3NZP4_PHLG1|nr:hypothetical protein PHLGIDRAFT_22003 [Phlebiopsis gigantea 11061_1 CR5-6]